MANRKYFGTDGVRGKVGTYPITPDFALKLGWAAGKVLASQGSRTVLIGKDTRISGYMLESALEAGLAAAGLTAAFTGPMPTPAVAYLTRTFRLEAGIVISASHNPYYDNGTKFFSSQGTKLPDDIEEAIEHIYNYSTKHSESIITENKETAKYFMESLDSACVYHNASTRFSDGGQFGFGAEVGISTQKLHARGPLGLQEITSTKYMIYGNGQVRS